MRQHRDTAPPASERPLIATRKVRAQGGVAYVRVRPGSRPVLVIP
jgi:hypothetical protein